MLKTRIYYSILIIGCFCFYLLYSDYISLVALLIFLLLPICLWIVNLIATRKVQVSIKMKNMICGQLMGCPISISIDNESAFPIGEARIYITSINQFSNDAFSNVISVPVSSDNVTNVQSKVISHHVGKVTTKINKVAFYDLFKLTKITKKLDISESYYVLPEFEKIYSDLKNKDALDEESNVYSQKKGTVNSADILDYHEYAQGDMIKNINWKLSSRLNELMVKEFTEPISNSALILFELMQDSKEAPSLTQVDHAMQTVCSVMQWLYQNNVGHKLAWYSNELNSLCKLDVKSQEDQIAVLQQIEDSSFYQEPKGLAHVLKRIEKHSYSNIFYITTSLSYEAANMLTDLNEFGKLNVLAIQKGNEELSEAIQQLLSEHDVNYLSLNEQNLKQQLQNIIA